MARFDEPTPAQEAAYQAWIASRPPHVQAVARQFDPWTLYRLTTSGHRVIVRGFDEGEQGEVTLRVVVSGEYNAVVFDRQVFGILPKQVEECELPQPGELLGTALTDPQDIAQFLAQKRDKIHDRQTTYTPAAIYAYSC